MPRNIPAYAGKTREYCSGYPAKPEHPRVCGENCASRRFACSNAGTSPRMRGKLCFTPFRLLKRRNIPAYAGKTPRRPRRPSARRRNIPAYAGKTEWHPRGFGLRAEHPRVCGENHFSQTSCPYQLGTSPRMRGKHHRMVWTVDDLRNIPAYAGKTRRGINSSVVCEEHPRVCGENLRDWGTATDSPGTSPRMRGKLTANRAGRNDRRNIPAYAGKTLGFRANSQPTGTPEHPRVCGENVTGVQKLLNDSGTSPRMRGKR